MCDLTLSIVMGASGVGKGRAEGSAEEEELDWSVNHR